MYNASSSGGYNVGVGQGTLYNNAGGGYNVALGTSALNGNSSGSYNIGVGYQAAYGSGANSGTIGIGENSFYAGGGGNDTAVGTAAGESVTGANDTFLGAGAGQGAGNVQLASAANATAVGCNAYTTGNNGTALGNGAAAAANQVSLGNSSVNSLLVGGAVTITNAALNLPSSTPSSWPSGPPAAGASVIASSNGTLYALSAQNNSSSFTSTQNLSQISGGGSGAAFPLAANANANGYAITNASGLSAGTITNAGLANANYVATDANGKLVSTNVPAATSAAAGIVKPDGTTITVSSGTISVPTATSAALGLVKPDGSTITVSGGTISAAQSSLSGQTTAGNTVLGYQALYSGGGGGSGNTAVGVDALYSGNALANNTAIGGGALQDLSSGQNNVAIGEGAMYNAPSGSHNMALGANSLYECNGGTYNVGLGDSALGALTSGSYDIGIGYDAGYGAGANSDIIAIGEYAFYTGGGGYNVGIGVSAGQNVTGSYNTFIGQDAGEASGQVPAVANSTAIGANSITTGNNATALGNGASAGANQVALGNSSVSSLLVGGAVTITNAALNLPSSTPSSWPSGPPAAGASVIASSNGTLYALSARNNSSSFTATQNLSQIAATTMPDGTAVASLLGATNASSMATQNMTGVQIAAQLGSTAVPRATADASGNTITTTYAPLVPATNICRCLYGQFNYNGTIAVALYLVPIGADGEFQASTHEYAVAQLYYGTGAHGTWVSNFIFTASTNAFLTGTNISVTVRTNFAATQMQVNMNTVSTWGVPAWTNDNSAAHAFCITNGSTLSLYFNSNAALPSAASFSWVLQCYDY
jgi:hypothetical protein